MGYYGYHLLYGFMGMVWLCMVGTFGRKFCGRLFWSWPTSSFQHLQSLEGYCNDKIWIRENTKWWTDSSSGKSHKSPSFQCFLRPSASSAAKRQGTVVDHSVPCAGRWPCYDHSDGTWFALAIAQIWLSWIQRGTSMVPVPLLAQHGEYSAPVLPGVLMGCFGSLKVSSGVEWQQESP